MDGVEGRARLLVSKHLQVIQINLNKAHAAQIELLNKINKLNTYIAFVTEPFCYKYKLSLPPKNSTIIPHKRTGQPRTAIYCSKDLNLSELDHLSNRDMVVGIMRMERKEVILISLYCDIKTDVITDDLKKAVEYGRTRGHSIIIAADTNAHSILWGRETNKRGKDLEDFIRDNDIQIHNLGREYTFE